MEMENLRKGPWFEEEDDRLRACVAILGERRWDSLAKVSGLRRSGKSCRLRWLNYLRPSLKQGPITPDEELIILQLHEKWGNKWSKIAQRLPGRTDNEIKNYWRTHLRRKMQIHMQSTTHLFPTPYNNNVLLLESSSSRDQTHNFNQDSSSFDEGDTFNKEVNSNDNQGELVGLYNNHNTTPIGASNYGITSSPYDQNHLSHWISSESKEPIDELSVGYMENNGSNLCFDYQVTWNVGYGGAWDYSDNLWDMDFISANFA